jgi:hypothetical protein
MYRVLGIGSRQRPDDAVSPCRISDQIPNQLGKIDWAAPADPDGKDVKIEKLSVLATRKPLM